MVQVHRVHFSIVFMWWRGKQIQTLKKYLLHLRQITVSSMTEGIKYNQLPAGWSAILGIQGWEGNGNPLQCSCLENPMDGGPGGLYVVHGVAKSQTRLSDFIFTFHFHALEKEMATHSSALAWRIPGTGQPGGLPSMGSHRVGHDWSGLAAAAPLLAGWTLSNS